MTLDERLDPDVESTTTAAEAAPEAVAPREQRFESFAEGAEGAVVADGDVEVPYMVT